MSFFFILHDIGWTFQSGTNIAWVVDTLAYAKNRFKLSKPRWSKFINEKNATLINHYERNDSSLETIENFHCIGDYTYKILPNTVEAAVASSYNLFNKLKELPSVK